MNKKELKNSYNWTTFPKYKFISRRFLNHQENQEFRNFPGHCMRQIHPGCCGLVAFRTCVQLRVLIAADPRTFQNPLLIFPP